MLAIYKRLEAEGKIGQFDPDGHPRPYQEYPKQVTTGVDDFGKPTYKIVHSQREELAFRAESVPGVKLEDDPVLAERNRLARENDELRAKLLALSGSQPTAEAVPLQTVKPSVLSPKAPTKLTADHPMAEAARKEPMPLA
jgi:hypothetical protein